MLRAIVLLLLLANAGFFAWREGWLAPLNDVIGVRPEGDREPQRLARQVRPDAVRLLAPEDLPALRHRSTGATMGSVAEPAAAASAGIAAAHTACLEAGPFALSELPAAQAALHAAWPAGSWAVRELPLGGAWWVALGPYRDAELLALRRDDLRRRGIASEQAASSPGSAPLLVLSRHDSAEDAQQALTAAAEHGLPAARVVEGTPTELRMLRVAAADGATQALLTRLHADRLRGHTFTACGASSASSD